MLRRPIGLSCAFILATAAALGGCIIAEDDDGDFGGGRFRDTVEYTCDDDREFTATFDGGDVRVRAAGETFDLEQTRGNRRYREYEGDGGARLTVDDDEAYLRLQDESDYTNCEEA